MHSLLVLSGRLSSASNALYCIRYNKTCESRAPRKRLLSEFGKSKLSTLEARLVDIIIWQNSGAVDLSLVNRSSNACLQLNHQKLLQFWLLTTTVPGSNLTIIRISTASTTGYSWIRKHARARAWWFLECAETRNTHFDVPNFVCIFFLFIKGVVRRERGGGNFHTCSTLTTLTHVCQIINYFEF
jgi:hypothetical protein